MGGHPATARCCSRCQVPDGVTVYRRDIDGAWFDGDLNWRGDNGRVVGDGSVANNNPHILESIGAARAVTIALVDRLIKGEGTAALCGHCEGQRLAAANKLKRIAKRRAGGPPAVRDLFQATKGAPADGH